MKNTSLVKLERLKQSHIQTETLKLDGMTNIFAHKIKCHEEHITH